MSTTGSATSLLDSVIAAKESQIKSQVTFALAAKQLSVQKQQGAAMVQLVEAAETLGRELGKGTLFDAFG